MKINAKIMLSVTASTLVFSFLLIFYLIHHERHKEIKRLNDKIESTVQLLESSSIEPLWDIDRRAITENLNAFFRDDEIISIKLRENSGAIDIRLNHKPGTRHTGDITKKLTIKKNDHILGDGEIVFSSSILDGRLNTIQNTMIWLTIASICFTAFVTYSVAIFLVKPIKKITQALARVDGGDYDYVLKLHTKDEFNEIEQYFNRMVSTIAREISSRNTLTERLEIATRAAHIGIWDWNVSDDELMWDDMICEIYGIPHSIITGTVMEFSKYLHPQDQSRVNHDLQAALRGECEYASEFRVIWPDGSIHNIKANSQVFFDENGKPLRMVGTNIDITEQRQAQQEILRLNAELEQRVQERTEQLTMANHELEAFSYSVSHDLRAPLRAVDGFSRMVVKDYADSLDDEGRRKLGVICSEAQRMGRLIDDLLAFSRLGRQQTQPEPIDMRQMAQEVYNELMGHELPDRKLKLDLQPLPFAEGTRTMIRQVWVNLIGNAIKFTKGREFGIIEIAAQTGEDGVPVFRIKDNGAGFDMRFADKLFGVFQRLHSPNEFPGTGVGLALVQRIVSRHGGHIWAVGEVDHGATFYFTLPSPSSESSPPDQDA